MKQDWYLKGGEEGQKLWKLGLGFHEGYGMRDYVNQLSMKDRSSEYVSLRDWKAGAA